MGDAVVALDVVGAVGSASSGGRSDAVAPFAAAVVMAIAVAFAQSGFLVTTGVIPAGVIVP